ncbi:hypothetical protein RCL1_008859 [Eukaryota sp. TZLM3-RCL]
MKFIFSLIASRLLQSSGRIFPSDPPVISRSNSLLSRLRSESCLSPQSVASTVSDGSHDLLPIGAVCSPSLSCNVALDIGGSLVKILFFEPFELENEFSKKCKQFSVQHSSALSVRSRRLGGTFHFAITKTADLSSIISLIKSSSFATFMRCLPATGGGAHKYSQLISQELSLVPTHHDEMDCLVHGLNFFLKEVPRELFLCFPIDNRINTPSVNSFNIFPYLLVNVGSGVSILKIDGYNKFVRVSGSGLGGATFFALAKLLGCLECSYDDLLSMAAKGDHKKVDMLVGDIYGTDYGNIGLSADVTAAYFGKLLNHENIEKVTKDDLVKGILLMITGNIAHLAYLIASQYNIKRIVFAGHFFRHDSITMASVSRGVYFWSAGQMKSCFLKHEGYLGAMGSWLIENHKIIKNS